MFRNVRTAELCFEFNTCRIKTISVRDPIKQLRDDMSDVIMVE